MKMRKATLFVLLLSLWSMAAWAQERSISGVIKDASDGSPVIGANVLIKGTTKGTITDFDGKFKLNVPSGTQVLTVTFVGYKQQEVQLGNKSIIEVFMELDAEQLEEVVVTAFGVKQEKKSLNYAVQEVNAAELAESQQSNMVNALQGKVAGVQITSSGGMPGASSQILIRGANSLSGNNQPLFVIDGIPVDNSSNDGGVNRAADINSADIESMTILKGPAAAALYGMDGANGAIIITTKSGKAGKTMVSFNSTVAIDQVGKLPEQQNMFTRGSSGLVNSGTTYMWGPMLRPDEMTYNNADAFFKTGVTYNNNISVSGGNEKTNFYLSANHIAQEGIVPETDYAKTSVLLKGSNKIRDNLTVGGSVNYILTDNTRGDIGYSGGWLQSLMVWPTTDDMSVYQLPNGEKRWLYPSLVDLEKMVANQSDNPFWRSYNNPVEDQTSRIIANANLNWKPIDNLSVTYRLGRDEYSYEYARTISYLSSSYMRGQMERKMLQRSITTSTLTAQYEQKFAQDFRLNVLVGHNLELYKSNSSRMQASNFINPELASINNTNIEDQVAEQGIRRRNRMGVFGDLKLDYKGIAYLGATARNDWSSTLPEANRSFFYPAVSAGFVFGELIPDNPILTYGKVHASYAEVGKDAPIQMLYPRLNNYAGVGGGFINYHTAGNPNLKPERTRSKEIGFDMAFLNGRVRLEGAYYDQTSVDQIITARISPVTGYIIQTFNGGTVQNTGYELMLDATVFEQRDFSWNSNVNFSTSESQLIDLPSFVSEFPVSQAQVMGTAAIGSSIREEPLFGVSGTDYMRAEDGRVMINEDGYPIVDTEKRNIGDRMPKYLIGWTNTFKYKDVSLSFLWDFRVGGDIMNATRYSMLAYGQDKMLEEYRREGFVFDGVMVTERDEEGNPVSFEENTKEVVLNQEFFNDYRTVGTNFMEEVNWARLRYVTLTYNLPKQWLSKVGVKNVQLTATGRNLLLFTNYSGGDPEVNSTGSGTGGVGTMGIDYYPVPLTKGLTFGLNAKF
ncbi:SusC/RagA family TonB-linked outer membrane protein [Limibacter armeniacum]|uniref:SusC/RagA family TonB-linked outer membrane protein n=1 Tax=Limibacter armeniacum TaxID=466084 RepID=UPI002FE5E898